MSISANGCIKRARRPLAVCLAAVLGLDPAFGGDATVGHGHPASAFSLGAGLPLNRQTSSSRVEGADASAPSNTLRVTNCDDTGPGSLRDAAARVEQMGTIDLTGLGCSTITLSTGAIHLTVDTLSIIGPGPDALTIASNGTDRVFTHSGTGSLAVAALTISGGVVHDAYGGCIYSPGNVSVSYAVVSGCRAQGDGTVEVTGGGVAAMGAVYIWNSTITGNRVDSTVVPAYAGGVWGRTYVSVRRSTISNNAATGVQGNTGGVLSSGSAVIAESTISGNQAAFNAGVADFGEFPPNGVAKLAIYSSTISGNVATSILGGVGSLADMYIVGSTIVNNRDGGGAIGAGLLLGASVDAAVYDTIIADNYSGDARDDVGGLAGATVEGSHNLVVASTLPLPPDTVFGDPMLAPLADNGGPTLTHALFDGSPAIDAGAIIESGYDQRGGGFARGVGTASDIGSYEVQSSGHVRTVTQCNGADTGTIYDAVAGAASGDTIDLTQLTCSTITLDQGPLQVPVGNLTFVGDGADRLAIDAGSRSGVVDHTGNGTLTISGLTVMHGYRVGGASADGGCVLSTGTISLDHAVVTQCRASSTDISGTSKGGAVNASRLLMRSSTISDSRAEAATGHAYGGGAYGRSLSMRDSTMAGNTALGSNIQTGTGGGAHFVDIDLSTSTISGNAAGIAGGVKFTYGSVIDSTISDNTAFFAVGGLMGSNLRLYNSTLAFNAAPGAGPVASGFFGYGSAARLQSAIVFGNTNGSSAYDIGLTNGVIAGSHNLIGAAATVLPADTLRSDPLLEPLADNGGVTLTRALRPASPAIDAGNNFENLSNDQRGDGFARVFGPAADIGAFERQTADPIFRDGFD